MSQAPLASNVKKLIALSAMHWFLPILPVIVLFFQANGLSFQQIMILQGAFALTVVLFEVPSGYMADLVGRKLSLVCGFILRTIGLACLCFSSSFSGFLIGEVFLAIGGSFISGADSALLFDSLAALQEEARYTRLEGRMQAGCNISEAVAAIAGGLLATLSLRAPLFLELPVSIACVFVALTLVEPERKKLEPRADDRLKTLLNIVYRTLWGSSVLKWIMLHTTLIGLSSFLIVWFVQPYFSLAGVPVVWFGTIWALLNATVAAGSIFAHRFAALFSKGATLALFSAGTCLAYLLLGSGASLFGLAPMLAIYLIRGLRTPLLRYYINERTVSAERATVLSINAMLFRLGFAAISPFVGAFADKNSPSALFLLWGGVFAVLLAASQFGWLRAEKKEAREPGPGRRATL